MARKVLTYKVPQAGRDQGKTFVLTEMPATQAEKWAIRLFLAMAKSGLDLPESVTESGMAGLAKMGLELLVKVNYADAEPLLDEMMACITIQPSPGITRDLVDDDIEEVATRIRLRQEIFRLHVDFFPAGGQSTSDQSPAPRNTVSVSMSTSR